MIWDTFRHFSSLFMILRLLDISAKHGLKWVVESCTLMSKLTKRVVKCVSSNACFGYLFVSFCLFLCFLSQWVSMSLNVSQCSSKCVKMRQFLQKVTTFSKPRPYMHFMEMIDSVLTFRHFCISALLETLRHYSESSSKSDRNLRDVSFRLAQCLCKKWPFMTFLCF